jgi:hypothetical protein
MGSLLKWQKYDVQMTSVVSFMTYLDFHPEVKRRVPSPQSFESVPSEERVTFDAASLLGLPDESPWFVQQIQRLSENVFI